MRKYVKEKNKMFEDLKNGQCLSCLSDRRLYSTVDKYGPNTEIQNQSGVICFQLIAMLKLGFIKSCHTNRGNTFGK